jgi:hypothetical protein
MIEFEIPELTQHSDQTAMITISDVIDPGFLFTDVAGQYMMAVPGDPKTDDLGEAKNEARTRFDGMLGVLRAFKHERGELAVELTRSIARDEHGNQYVPVGTAKAYVMFPGVLDGFATNAAAGMAQSVEFRGALRLFGSPNRDARVFYNIYELANTAFGGTHGIAAALALSGNQQKEFTKSANHLGATDGGRHAADWVDPGKATMTMGDLSKFATELMAAWIHTYDPRSQSPPHVVQYQSEPRSPEVDQMDMHRIRPDNATKGHPETELVGVPRAEVEAQPELAWCLDFDRTDDVPELQRRDDYIYVSGVEWDRRFPEVEPIG